MKKSYFPELDTLRFYAALSILVHHAYRYPEVWFGVDYNPPLLSKFTLSTNHAMTLFFTLSGFLITSILLKEKDKYKTISIKRFYFRRILRIYPVYLLIILISLLFSFIVPTYPYTSPLMFVLSSFFLANIGVLFSIISGTLGHLWSLSLEEQFYIFAPAIVKHSNSIAKIFMGIILLKWLSQLTILIIILVIYSLNLGVLWGENLIIIRDFIDSLWFECIAIGGLGAYLLHNHKNNMQLIFHPLSQYVLITLTIVLSFLPINIGGIFESILATLYSLIIVNIAGNPEHRIKIAHPILSYLGKISYGIYMYHPSISALTFIALQSIHRADNVEITVIFCIIVTLIVSAISYKYLELPFLQLKARY